jgi:hypothetical protein
VTADLIDIETQALLDILPRLSAMNSFIRSAAAQRGMCGGPLAYVVYHYKGEALIRGTRLGIIAHRSASTLAKCRACDGTGRYVDWDGFKHPNCRRCNSKGYLALEFVESTFTDETSWLTPREKAWRFVRSNAELPPSPNTPHVQVFGKDLTVDQVAEHMCEIEAFFATSRPDPYYDRDGNAWDYFANYRLYVGETVGTCPICSTAVDEESGHRHGLSTGRLSWTAVVCPTCRALHCNSIFEVLKPALPAAFLTPAVRRWVETHPVVDRSARD